MSTLDNNAPDSGTVKAGKSYGSTYSGKEMAGSSQVVWFPKKLTPRKQG